MDLQKYREKKALAQEKARQQEQKKQEEKFNTAVERVDLQHAFKMLKADPTLEKIVERKQQLDQWDERLNKKDESIRWKNNPIRRASYLYCQIHSFKHQIQQEQQRMDEINWFNPLKRKDNRMTKERAEKDLSNAQNRIKSHDKKLNDHRKELGFRTEKEFNQIKHQHETDHPRLLEKNRETRKHISNERDILKKAENTHENAFVRQTASLLP